MASSKARSGNRPSTAKNNSTRTRTNAATNTRGATQKGGAAAQKGDGTAQRAGAAAQKGRAAARAEQRRAATVAEPVEEPPAGAPPWLRILTLVLAIVGLGVSAYLTYEHYNQGGGFLGCAENSTVNCQKVTTSSQSMIFGAIPVALTGLIYYVFVVAIMTPWAWKSSWEWMPKLRLATVVAGMGMVLYLVYAELFQISAICLYCTSVHVITFILFSLVVVAAALWGLSPIRPSAPTRPADPA